MGKTKIEVVNNKHLRYRGRSPVTPEQLRDTVTEVITKTQDMETVTTNVIRTICERLRITWEAVRLMESVGCWCHLRPNTAYVRYGPCPICEQCETSRVLLLAGKIKE